MNGVASYGLVRQGMRHFLSGLSLNRIQQRRCRYSGLTKIRTRRRSRRQYR